MEENQITLDDLRQKLNQINQALVKHIKSRRTKLYVGAAAAVAAAVFISYLVGKNRGGRK